MEARIASAHPRPIDCANDARRGPTAQGLRSLIRRFIGKAVFSRMARSLRWGLEPGGSLYVCHRSI